MKDNKFTPIAVSILAVASMGMPTLAIAQTPVEPQPTTCPGSLFGRSESLPGPGHSDWQAEFAAIDLSPDQVSQVCKLKATLDREAFGPGFSLERVIEWANSGEQGEQTFRQSAIAQAIRNYNASIQKVLTPTQYQQWVQNGGGERQ
jgi:hypothetical protein